MHKGQNGPRNMQGNGEGQNAMPQQDGMNRNRYGSTQEEGPKHQGAGRHRSMAEQGLGSGNGYDATQPNPYYNTQNNPYYDPAQSGTYDDSSNRPLFASINTIQLLTGALIGAAAAYVLSSEEIQKKLFKGIAAMGDIVSGGLDEIKERYEDAKAEYEAGKGA